MAKRIRIYVGMALTEAPSLFRKKFQTELKDALKLINGVKILDFVGLKAGSNVDVYRHDRKCTITADLCVFIADYPSIGLGMEIAMRQEFKKPLLVFLKQGNRVTRMLTGALATRDQEICMYRDAIDIKRRVRKELRRLGIA